MLLDSTAAEWCIEAIVAVHSSSEGIRKVFLDREIVIGHLVNVCLSISDLVGGCPVQRVLVAAFMIHGTYSQGTWSVNRRWGRVEYTWAQQNTNKDCIKIDNIYACTYYILHWYASTEKQNSCSYSDMNILSSMNHHEDRHTDMVFTYRQHGIRDVSHTLRSPVMQPGAKNSEHKGTHTHADQLAHV